MGAAIIIIGIILMVVIHEMGHFVAAKFFNMKATKAFWGFGPKLWSMQKGETEYGIKALPLGGYVRIVGMNPLEEIDPEEEHRTYRAKPFYQKAIVVLAGITSHFVIAFILFTIVIFGYGSSAVGEFVREPVVESVTQVLATPNAPESDEIGIRLLNADEVIAVDGIEITAIDPNTTRPRGEISVVQVLRDGEIVEIETTDIVRPSPARIAGVAPDDRIVEFGGVTIGTWEDFVAVAHANAGNAIPVVLDRGGELVELTVSLTINVLSDGTEVGFFGVSPILADLDLGSFRRSVSRSRRFGPRFWALLSVYGAWSPMSGPSWARFSTRRSVRSTPPGHLGHRSGAACRPGRAVAGIVGVCQRFRRGTQRDPALSA